mmetsp:Transcript_18890/g.38477  ORF Transcript_18890/g.38477 Transcript_18890/m.38477 type:complete len:232 (-) Transcript_18890:307-1002(-)
MSVKSSSSSTLLLAAFRTVLISVLIPVRSPGDLTNLSPFTRPSSLSVRGTRVGSMTTFVNGERFPFSSNHFAIAHRSYTFPSPARTGSRMLSKVSGHSPQSFCRRFPGVRFRISEGLSKAIPCLILTSSPQTDCKIAASCATASELADGDRNLPRSLADTELSFGAALHSLIPFGLWLLPLASHSEGCGLLTLELTLRPPNLRMTADIRQVSWIPPSRSGNSSWSTRCLQG